MTGMQSPNQSLAAGSTMKQRYEGLGFGGSDMRYPLGKLFGMISGPPNAGKSSIFQSNPEAFIFNLDLSSTVIPNCPACIWPGISEDGNPIDTDGSDVNLTWDGVINKYNQLMDLAGRRKERPATVVIDSLGAAIALAKDHVMKQYNKETWRQVDGRAGWEDVYGGIVRLATSLRKAGYGVFYTCHIVNSVIQLGDDRWTERSELSITSAFWKRFFPYLEFSAVIHPVTETVNEKLPGETKTVNGREIQIPGKTVARQVSSRVLTTTDDKFEGITKSRTELNITIPRNDPWQALASAYEADPLPF